MPLVKFPFVFLILVRFLLYWAVFDKHTVKYKGEEVHNLNELEYVRGEVWANVWQVCQKASSLVL